MMVSSECEPLTVKLSDVPRVTGLSRATIERAVAAGELPITRPTGRRTRLVWTADLTRWLNGGAR